MFSFLSWVVYDRFFGGVQNGGCHIYCLLVYRVCVCVCVCTKINLKIEYRGMYFKVIRRKWIILDLLPNVIMLEIKMNVSIIQY